MKNILLIEDDYNKINNINSYIESLEEFNHNIELHVKKSFQSGIEAILCSNFDLLLLDMSMHNFEKTSEESGGEFMQFAGEDIMGEMIWSNIDLKTVVITQYDFIGDKTLEELQERWNSLYAQVYCGTIFYSANETEWKSELKNYLVKYLYA